MEVLFSSKGLEVVLFEGEKGYRGLGVVPRQNYDNPLLYLYDPEIVKLRDAASYVINEMSKGLSSWIKEFLTARAVFLEDKDRAHRVLVGELGLEIVRSLTEIVARGIKLSPSLPELGRRIGRILRDEREVRLRSGYVAKSYDQLYSLSKVIEATNTIAKLEDAYSIEIRAGTKKEYGPDLKVRSSSGKEVLVEVTARRPSKRFNVPSQPMQMDKFINEIISMDLERVTDKARRQGSQVRQANCLIVNGWHSALGLAPLNYFSKMKPIEKVEGLKGLCLYVSWIDNSGRQNLLLHLL